MSALHLAAVFIRDQVRNFPALHRWLTDFVWADVVKRHPPVFSRWESMEIIVREGASVARFGDGEYKQMRNKNMRRQRHSKELAARLREILYADAPGFYAAVLEPVLIDNGQDVSDTRKRTLVHNYRTVTALGDRQRLNMWISQAYSREYIDLVKRLWHNRNVVLITNPDTRDKAANCGLLANAKQVDFIEVTVTHAFSQCEAVFRQAKNRPAGTLFILACGPTANVLAFDLHQLGFQAVDIGSFINGASQTMRGAHATREAEISHSSVKCNP